MKKVLTVLVVFFFLFVAQNVLAQKDPFELAKEIAMTGKFFSYQNDWEKEVIESNFVFSVCYKGTLNRIIISKYPESGDGEDIVWTKYLSSGKYQKEINIVENFGPVEALEKGFVTREEAEKGAWEILKHFGYTKS